MAVYEFPLDCKTCNQHVPICFSFRPTNAHAGMVFQCYNCEQHYLIQGGNEKTNTITAVRISKELAAEEEEEEKEEEQEG